MRLALLGVTTLNETRPRKFSVPPVTIGIVISSLGPGGAERVCCKLAGQWVARGQSVTIYSFEDESARPFYELEPGVALKSLGLLRDSTTIVSAVRRNLHRIAKLRKVLRNDLPDYVLAIGPEISVLTILASRGLPARVYALERVYPDLHQTKLLWRVLRRAVYPGADTLVVQTKRIADRFGYLRRVTVIPNPVIPFDAAARTEIRLRDPAIIAVGRLDRQKRYDLLIDAFAMIAAGYPDWNLYIFGEGPLRQELARRIRQHGLNERIALAGLASPMDPLLRQAKIFVLCSDYEGFPNTLCEAMACGVPVIATDCRSGPREIIRDGVDGILIERGSAQLLSGAIKDLIDDPNKRNSLGIRGPEVTERFSFETIIGLWDSAFYDSVRCQNNLG